jgi:nucleoside-diphosphate-sugar epimerase
MKVLVTGSAGHLGEALIRTPKNTIHEVIDVDIVQSDFTSKVGSVIDRDHVKRRMASPDAVFHTATVHKPHVFTHSRQSFVDTNITGTLNLLEEAVSDGVGAFVFTSTTSVFGGALTTPDDAPAVWVACCCRSLGMTRFSKASMQARNSITFGRFPPCVWSNPACSAFNSSRLGFFSLPAPP